MLTIEDSARQRSLLAHILSLHLLADLALALCGWDLLPGQDCECDPQRTQRRTLEEWPKKSTMPTTRLRTVSPS